MEVGHTSMSERDRWTSRGMSHGIVGWKWDTHAWVRGTGGHPGEYLTITWNSRMEWTFYGISGQHKKIMWSISFTFRWFFFLILLLLFLVIRRWSRTLKAMKEWMNEKNKKRNHKLQLLTNKYLLFLVSVGTRFTYNKDEGYYSNQWHGDLRLTDRITLDKTRLLFCLLSLH